MNKKETSAAPARATSLWAAFGLCGIIALGCLLFCSKSSPLYPLNDWSDANIYFSIGKGMLQGQVVYRDLYDHKGPLLYALHALCAAMSPLSFLGVFILEVLAFALFLLAAYQLWGLYDMKGSRWLMLPVLALVVLTSLSFQQGDSAEELCLPLLMGSMYALLKHFKGASFAAAPCSAAPSDSTPLRPMPPKTLMIHGFMCGCVLWIKFTLLGLYVGWVLAVFLSLAARRQWKAAWMSLLSFGGGVAAATVPWLIYFGSQGALLPWLKTYLYDNLFLYSAGEEALGLAGRIKAMVKAGAEWWAGNLRYTLLLTGGFLWCVFRKGAGKGERWSLLMMLGFGGLAVFAAGKAYLYYGLILAPFAALGFIPLGRWVDGKAADMGKVQVPKKALGLSAARAVRGVAIAIMTVATIGLCWPLSPNTTENNAFLQPKEKTMQYQFAAVMAETPGATMLNYGFMDAGFYTAAGIVPNVKYFHQTNVPLQEMLDEQKRYIEEGVCDYVVTRGRQPDSITDNYQLVATVDTPEGFWYEHVYLYKLKSLME